MRILYGMAGEGNGHATRSKTVIDHLQRGGHRVLVAASKQAYEYFRKHPAFGGTDSPRYPIVEIRGYEIRYQGDGMDLPGTIGLNLATMPTRLQDNWAAAKRIDHFKPQAVITDLEPFAYYYAKMNGLPLISIDNHQAMPRCVHPTKVIDTNPVGFGLISTFVSVLMPNCDHYIVTTFAPQTISPAIRDTTTLVPPILRENILQVADLSRRKQESPHVLVYQTTKGGAAQVFRTLQAVPQHFIVYGMKNSEEASSIQGNCLVKSFNEKEFINDLATSHAIVSNGGYSLLSEAVALQKPVFSVPMKHHAEQIFNASYIHELGYGQNSPTFDVNSLTNFLRQSSRFAARLRSIPQHDNNARLYAILDRFFPPTRGISVEGRS